MMQLCPHGACLTASQPELILAHTDHFLDLGAEDRQDPVHDALDLLHAEGAHRACLGAAVFETIVPRNVRLSEAPSHGLPALIYDLKCPGSEAYVRLAREVMARLARLREVGQGRRGR